MIKEIKSLNNTFMINNVGREIFVLTSQIDIYTWYLFDIENKGLHLYYGMDSNLFDASARSTLRISEECDVI